MPGMLHYARNVGVLLVGSVGAYISKNKGLTSHDDRPGIQPLLFPTSDAKRVVVVGNGVSALFTAYYIMARLGYVAILLSAG